jgi:hypothetical protein
MENNPITATTQEMAQSFTPCLQNTLISNEGLVIKNAGKIEEIITKIEMRTEAQFLSWQVCRAMRRDFNLLSAKIFKGSLQEHQKKYFKAQIRDLMMEMVLQGEFLKAESSEYKLTYEPEIQVVPLRIVSPETGLLYRIFSEVDLPIATLACASFNGILSKKNFDNLIASFFSSYSDLKSYLIGYNKQFEKSAAEIGRDEGIT